MNNQWKPNYFSRDDDYLSIDRESENTLFGGKISTVGKVREVRNAEEAAERYGVEWTLAKFNGNEKHKLPNAHLKLYHGRYKAADPFPFCPDRLEYKKILVGQHSDIKDKDSRDLVDMMTLENELACFKKFSIIVDLKEASPEFCVPEDADFCKQIWIYPCMGKFYFNGEEIELNEASILKAMKCTTKVLDVPPTGNCFKLGNYHWRLEEKQLDGANERSVRVVSGKYKKALKNFEVGRVETSGSCQKNSSILLYLNMGEGIVPVTSGTLETVGGRRAKKNGSCRPKCFVYRDAKDNADKLHQPFNSGSTIKCQFLPEGNKDAVIVGYTDEYIDKLLKDWWKEEDEEKGE